MAVEQVAELQLFAEHIEGFVSAEALRAWRGDAAINASGQCTALEAMAGQIAPAKTGRDGARLDDVGDRASGERRFANLGRGGGVFGGLSRVPGVDRQATPAGRLLRARRPPRAPGARFTGTPGRR